MKEFAALFSALDSTTSTKKKTDALLLYFQRAQPADAAWALYFLAGGKPRQTVPTGLLEAITATGAPRVIVTHGYVEPLVRFLAEQGLESVAFKTEYGDDEDVKVADEPAATESP